MPSNRIATVSLIAAMLVGCADRPTSQQSDIASNGRWVGFFESSLGPLGCPGRSVMEVTVEDRLIVGDAQGNGFVMSVIGTLGDDGSVQDGVFRRDNKAAAIVTGTFLKDTAAGRWQGASCEGIWSLRRVSN